MNDDIVYCADCSHYRLKTLANPFSNVLDVWTPDILAAKNEWEQEQREIALNEQQRIEAGLDFDYEPNYVPWCWRWTYQESAIEYTDPVSRETSPVYIPCARGNPDGQCGLFEAKDEAP